MKSGHAMPLFRVALAGLIVRGSGWLLLVGALVFAWLGPLVTPWEENPQILQPARAQAVWMYAWFALFTWLPFQAASLGHRMRREGMLEHLRAGGMNAFSLCLQLTASLMVWIVGLTLIAVLVCVTLCLPKNPMESSLWLQLVTQYSLLFLVCAAPLTLLSVALGTCAGEVVAFLTPFTLLLVGLFGASWLAPILSGSEASPLKLLWLVLPHYHLADLTPRLVFKMGPLPAADFVASIGSLGLQGAALCLIGLCSFRTRS